MRDQADDDWLAGLDGCPAGWVCAFVRPSGGEVRLRIVPRFADVLMAPEAPAIIAVDIPIGLPERVGHGGRAAENAVRPLLGARQSSVFSVPSRAAVEAADYRTACGIALATSDPPRSVSKQLFMFWRLNGGRALDQPKKVKGRCFEPGLALRRRLLVAAGLPASVVQADPPKGAGPDDLLDALACAAIARRIYTGVAQSFPDRPERDAFVLRMTIWA
jgi:predicted RNase H-like nuclease